MHDHSHQISLVTHAASTIRAQASHIAALALRLHDAPLETPKLITEANAALAQMGQTVAELSDHFAALSGVPEPTPEVETETL